MKPSIANPVLNRRQFMKGTLAGSALLAAAAVGIPSRLYAAAAESGTKPFELPPLPYAEDALEPCISARTISFHYGKHHQGYINKLNGLIQNTEFEKDTLGEIIKKTAGNPDKTAIFNNAAQAWNHTFYWKSMKHKGGGAPAGDLAKKIAKDFGDFENFKKIFEDSAVAQFGSGWTWLVMENGTLKVMNTGNADTPLAHGRIPLITIDVWEHAYYLDYQNRRVDYVTAFVDDLVDWDFAAQNFSKS